jgi:hypothetical protein
MSEKAMVERVRVAIMRAYDDAPDGEEPEAMARAAIEAMREPTKAMVSAGCLLDEDLEWAEHDYAVPKIWGTMIDAALKEPK